MTRTREQIVNSVHYQAAKAALRWYNEDIESREGHTDAFEDGYVEGYNKAVDKAYEWLEEHLQNYWGQMITDPTKFIEKFKKSMQEES